MKLQEMRLNLDGSLGEGRLQCLSKRMSDDTYSYFPFNTYWPLE